MTQAVAEKVRQIIADQALIEVEAVTMDATLDQLGVDSLGLVEAVFAIEESFDISVPFNANDPGDSEFDIKNVASIIAAVESLMEKQKS